VPDSEMLKPVVQLAAVGLVGVVLWKLAAAFLLPLFFLVFKIGLIVALIMLAFWFFNKKSRGKEDTPPPSSECPPQHNRGAPGLHLAWRASCVLPPRKGGP